VEPPAAETFATSMAPQIDFIYFMSTITLVTASTSVTSSSLNIPFLDYILVWTVLMFTVFVVWFVLEILKNKNKYGP